MAAAAATGGPLVDINGVRQCLSLCRCNSALRAAIEEKGIDEMDQSRYLKPKHVDDMAKQMTRLPATRGGTRFGRIQVNKVQALVQWVKECIAHGEDLDVNEFTQAALDDIMRRVELE